MKDHCQNFWFRHAQPNRSHLEHDVAQTILEKKVTLKVDHFVSLTFTEVCKQFFLQSGLFGKLPCIPTNIGNWWKANEEFNLLTLRGKETILVEYNRSSKLVGIEIISEVERKAKFVKTKLENCQIKRIA